MSTRQHTDTITDKSIAFPWRADNSQEVELNSNTKYVLFGVLFGVTVL